MYLLLILQKLSINTISSSINTNGTHSQLTFNTDIIGININYIPIVVRNWIISFFIVPKPLSILATYRAIITKNMMQQMENIQPRNLKNPFPCPLAKATSDRKFRTCSITSASHVAKIRFLMSGLSCSVRSDMHYMKGWCESRLSLHPWNWLSSAMGSRKHFL